MSVFYDLVVCDLRQFDDVEKIMEIESISDVCLLVLPKNAPDEIKKALAMIPCSDVATTLYLDKNDILKTINGFGTLTENDFSDDGNTVFVVNGVVIVEDVTKEIKGSVILNGLIIIKESIKNYCHLSFPMLNGNKIYADFDYYKNFPRLAVIDEEFLSYLKPNTIIFSDREIIIEKNVMLESLKKMNVQFFAGNKITCGESISSYVRANSFFGNELKVIKE